MPAIHIPRGWEISENQITPEAVYLNRRAFLRAMGFGGLGIVGFLSGCSSGQLARDGDQAGQPSSEQTVRSTIPEASPPWSEAVRTVPLDPGAPITEETVAASYNNFYEFTTKKDGVWPLASKLTTDPWTVEVSGLVKKPQVFDIDDLIRQFPHEERVYRFRCVEAWAMVVPWVGFPLKDLIKRVEPTSEARYLRFETFNRPRQAPGIASQSYYPWPYREGLTLEEATNDLTLLVTGIYGHRLPKQHGAPIRLITPWKFGFKSIKSIVKIEFTDQQPSTFWNDAAPREYTFWANINPKVPHPRWSQATERLIGSDERRPTLLYNGYGEWVAHLYPDPNDPRNLWYFR